MPKRQRTSRYSIVAAEEEETSTSTSTPSTGTNNRRSSTRSGSSSTPTSSTSTSTSTSTSNSSSSKTRNRNSNKKGQNQRRVLSSSSSSSSSSNNQKQQQQQLPNQKQQQQRQKEQQQQQQQHQKVQQRLASGLLLQLLNACEKHHTSCHPNYNHSHDFHHHHSSDENDLPIQCKNAIKSLREFIPKLERAIPPKPSSSSSTSSSSTASASAPASSAVLLVTGKEDITDTDNDNNNNNNNSGVSMDVIQLCRFYDNVVRGNYCPHLPHIFEGGTNPELILDKVWYLLRHSLNANINSNNSNSSNNNKESSSSSSSPSTDNDNATATATTYLDCISRTIAGLLSFVVDDSNKHIRRKIFVDWIDFSEDIAVLMILLKNSSQQTHQQQQQQYRKGINSNNDGSKISHLPVRLSLFEETSLVIQERRQQEQGNDEGETSDSKKCNSNSNNCDNYSLELYRWEQVQILQTIVLNVLNALTSNGSALERLQTSPEQHQQQEIASSPPPEQPSMLLGGDVDLSFPSDIVTDTEIVSSLLASFKPAMMLCLHNKGYKNDDNNNKKDGHDDDVARENEKQRKKTSSITVEIMIRLCLDWHRLGSATIAIPLLPSIIDAAILTARTVRLTLLQMPSSRQEGQDDDDANDNYYYEERLALLLNQIVCHPPGFDDGYDKDDDDDDRCVAKAIHSTVWTVLLDCLEGIAFRLRQRRQITCQHYQQHERATSSSSSTLEPPTSCVVVLDVAVLQTIHFIAASTPSLAHAGSNYCTARGLFPNLFLLSSSTSLAGYYQDNHDNNCDDNLLLRAACQTLGVLLHASASDANSACLLEEACQGTLKRHVSRTNEAILQPRGDVGLAGFGKRTTKVALEINGAVAIDDKNDKDNRNDGHIQVNERRNSKRKRGSLTPEPLDLSISTVRRATSNKEMYDVILYPAMWYDALGTFFDHLLDVGKNIKESYVRVASDGGNCDRFMVERVVEQLRCLSGGLRLALSLIRKISISTGISRVARELSGYLLSACGIFLHKCKNPDTLRTPLGYAVADALIGCGLSMHFSKLESDGQSIDFARNFLDSVSSFSGRLLELGPQQQYDGLSCNTCTGIPAYFTEDIRCQTRHRSYRDIYSIVPSSCCKNAKEWLFDKSITVLDSFPLFVRAALLSSLHPVLHNAFPTGLNEEIQPLFGSYSLDVFVTFFIDYAKAKKRDSTEIYSKKNIASLLHLLPLMLVPRGDGQGISAIMMGEVDEKENDSDPSNSSSFARAILLLLRNGLNPLIESLKDDDNFIFQSLFSTLGHIQTIVDDVDIGFSMRDPSSILEFIVPRHKRLQDVESKKDEVSSILRGMMFLVANRAVRNDDDHISRYLIWMCAARYCVSATSSEIRQQLMAKSFQITAIGSDEERTKQSASPRDGLLSWLVAAPFSDPNCVLRKYISRELPYVLTAKEHSFLVSRFSSSESFQEYCTYSRVERKDRGDEAMASLVKISDEVVHGLFEEIDGLLNECCGISDKQLSLSIGKESRRDEEHSNHRNERESHLTMQRTAAGILASLCYNAGLDHPIGRTLFEKGALRLIRMWADTSNDKGDSSFPELRSTSSSRASAFGGLSCLSESRSLSICFSDEISWTYFPSAILSDVFIVNDGKSRREQYELLESLVRTFFTLAQDSLEKMKSTDEASRIIDEVIPLAIAQLVIEKDEEMIPLITGFDLFLTERCMEFKTISRGEIQIIGNSQLQIKKQKSSAISMGIKQLEKKTKDLCLKKIDRILPLVLFRSDQDEALPLKFFTRLIAPVTLSNIMDSKEQLILKGITWEIGRNPYKKKSAARALKTAALACQKDHLDGIQLDNMPGTTAAKLWVTKHFMYLLANTVQLNWNSRNTSQQIQALSSLYILLDFLNSSEAAQYFPQVLAAVNVAINDSQETHQYKPDNASLRLHAVRCLSKFIRLSTEDNIEVVIDNLTTIVVSLLPILGDYGFDLDGSTLQESRDEAVSMLEFLTRAEFVRKFPKAYSEIPFLPAYASLANVHKSLRDNGINFDNLLILSTSTSESQTRRGSLTSENTSKASSLTSPNGGDSVLALQNRLSLVCSLLDNENTSVRSVALQHLVDLLRANRDLFHSLVENDGGSSIKNYLTVIFKPGSNDGSNDRSREVTSVTISEMIEKLMRRCVHETDPRVRLKLATCLGEIGAIGENRLDDMSLFRSKRNESVSMYQWRLDHPPWQSRAAKYELQLVTKCLVVALKAAPSSGEQIKISFTIQQLLELLDESVKVDENTNSTNDQAKPQKGEMSKWLLDRLIESKVYDSVEPFWSSEFSTKTEGTMRQPPFFRGSDSYYVWISQFCRWMITKSNECALSRWKDFFFACRTAVRSLAGLETAEFIFPLLVLDRICFGSAEELELICQELRQVLDFESDSVRMELSDRQKAVGGFFKMMGTLTHWVEHETEERYRSKRNSNSKRSTRGNPKRNTSDDSASILNWPVDETITQINLLISRIPLIDQARAATKVGMHAKSLRLLETVARQNIVEKFFESSDDKSGEILLAGSVLQSSLLESADLDLMRTVLSNLNDCETMNIVGENSYLSNPLLQVSDSIQWKEASGNYEGALRDYERALQVRKVDSLGKSDLERGALDCMLKLGRFESILSRALTQDTNAEKIASKSFAVEAAWRLGQWDRLSGLVEENKYNKIYPSSDDEYRQATGEAIVCLRDQAGIAIADSLQNARASIMDNLSSVASESYSRAYADIVRLQCIRELEDSATLLCNVADGDFLTLSEVAESRLHQGWAWEGRLKLTTPHAASEIMNTRVAIARLGNDPVMESSLLLGIGRQARNDGMPTVAENFYSQAEAALSLTPGLEYTNGHKLDSLLDDVRVQYAKLKNESGENILALKILGQGMVENAFSEMIHDNGNTESMMKIAVKHERLRAEKTFGVNVSAGNEKHFVDRFAKRLLRLTQWTVEGGMQSGNEIIDRFQTVIRLSPEWEKGHFHFAKYLNELVTRFFEKDSPHGMNDDVMRFNALYRDKVCHNYILLAIEHYALALKFDMKHVYQTLPRLLSLWFDFVSVKLPKHDSDNSYRAVQPEYLEFLISNQNRANVLMADNIKAIPAAAYYTAIPQLASRVMHDDEDTAKIVKRILERVLVKFPPQAMWHLAWLKGSKNNERSAIGGEIFKGAIKVLVKNRQVNVANLLRDSDSLFKFLQDLARHTGSKPGERKMLVRPWKGEMDLTEFIPPVQAALSISPFKSVKSSSKEYFPRVVPRMRAFSSNVGIMMSKAKPKKLKAFAVPGTWKNANMSGSNNTAGGKNASANPLACDIGEIHFLVKQEAKGDLRKDARVQDLNNVINRLMASSNNSNSTLASRSRRLRVRTFAVTCLSEDTGILEWVPDTDSMRNLVSKSYNPQTTPYCPRRRGSRMTNFGDASMRSNFERSQNQFFKNGCLTQAAKMYYNLCLKQNPPVLSWWFVQHFSSATDWYEARKKFTLTAAAWSAIGHVIGLGDRHSENILVETTTGRIIHVDFDCIFDKGLNLPRPEVVPFRLTPNMLDAFGPTGADGMFSSGMESCLEILRANRDTLLSVLEPFIKDPVIDWKRHRTQQTVSSTRIPSHIMGKDSHGEAKRSIHVIKERLSGICNLRNPNYRKLRNIIPKEQQQGRTEEDMIEILPLSVEGQVQKLCAEASKNENLIQLYVGWMPWV